MKLQLFGNIDLLLGTNYFLIISTDDWISLKDKFLSKLRAINDILLVFESIKKGSLIQTKTIILSPKP